MRRPTLLALVVALPLGACGSDPAVEGPAAVYQPGSGSLMDAPWPTDDRIVDGHLDLSGFPRSDIPLIQRYLDVGETFEAWGTSQPIYFPLEAFPPEDRLPTPAGSLEEDSGLLLVDIDPDSPMYGERFPVQWELVPSGTMVPHPTLAVAPVFGFPLRPDTTYAVLVTNDVVAPSTRFLDRLDEDPALAVLADALGDVAPKAKELAVGTVFTTRDPTAEMARLVQATRAIEAPDLSQAIEPVDENLFYRSFLGSTEGPLWQHGEKPYNTEGGGFRFGADGTPEMAELEELRLVISTPKDLSNPPAGGWPVVVYAHGTGGDAFTFANESNGLEVASQLARAGIVGIGFDQPLHGTRGTPDTNLVLHSFNYLNPESGRAAFRQGALDILWLVHALRSHDITLTAGTDTIPLDSDTVMFFGHSHGGLTGSIAGPWLGDDTRGAVFSGAGGGLAITLVERKDPQDIAALIALLLQFQEGEELTRLHPAAGLVQLLVEETDPLNYAPYWLSQDLGASSRPLPVLLTSGQHDVQTHHETAEALAAAAGLNQVQPAWNAPDGLVLRGLEPLRGPVSDNVIGFDGQPVTGVLSQWEDGDHFVVFQDSDASGMVRDFLETAIDGSPEVDPF